MNNQESNEFLVVKERLKSIWIEKNQDPNHPLIDRAISVYIQNRNLIFTKIPELYVIYNTYELTSEELGTSEINIVERFLWNLNYAVHFRDSKRDAEECKEIITGIIQGLCSEGWKLFRLKRLIFLVIGTLLSLEKSTRGGVFGQLFNSKEILMLSSLVQNIESGITIEDLKLKLKLVESHGVFLNPGVFKLLDSCKD